MNNFIMLGVAVDMYFNLHHRPQLSFLFHLFNFKIIETNQRIGPIYYHDLKTFNFIFFG